MLRRLRLKYLSLFLFGGTLGVLGLYVYTDSPRSTWVGGVVSSAQHEGGPIALACTAPADDSEDIFFISCGGIY